MLFNSHYHTHTVNITVQYRLVASFKEFTSRFFCKKLVEDSQHLADAPVLPWQQNISERHVSFTHCCWPHDLLVMCVCVFGCLFVCVLFASCVRLKAMLLALLSRSLLMMFSII